MTAETRLGVVGWPVAHSRSPAMQNAALAAVGLGDSWRYQLLPVPPELFAETVQGLRASGFRGVNVTIPHKHAALSVATTATDRARAIGAANTLIFADDGSIHADNTDAPALTAAIASLRPTAGASALVLGAGGSARAAVWALLDAGASDVYVWNRTPERAQEVCAAVGGIAVGDVGLVGPTDVLVNSTSVGLHEGDNLSQLPVVGRVEDFGVVVDFVYTEHGTQLLDAACAAGVPTIDGLELLVGQGAIAFEQFTGRPAPLDAMRAAVGLSSAP
jgi:shikimate dehydrogenase